MKKQLITILFIMLSPVFAFGAAHYVTSSGQGSKNGTDWVNAYQGLPSTLIRGDVYYLSGGTYSGRTFSTSTQGTAIITIKGATVDDHGTNTGWSDTYSVENIPATWTSAVTFSTSYWVFNGSIGPTWSKTPSDYGFVFSGVSHPITVGANGANTTNFTISHIAATAPSGDTEKFFVSTGNTWGETDNVTISYCYLNGWQNGYWATSPLNGTHYQDNWIFEYNVCLNGYSSGNHHGEWVNNNYGKMLNQITRYNLFESGGMGMTGIIVANNNDNVNPQIYGNVFKDLTVSNGVITSTSQGTMQNAKVYNNTFINVKTSGGWLGMYTSSGSVANNNMLYNMDASPGGSGYTRDYNAYYSCTNVPSESHRQTGSINPFINLSNGDFRLSSETDPGMTLSSIYGIDVDGVIRGADGTWDRGAYDYEADSGTASNSTPPAAPSNLRIVNN